MLYLWTTLVVPVLSYGTDQFAWSEDELSPNIKEQNAAFRNLLKVSTRATIDAVTTLLDVPNCTTIFRASRAAHFLRLFNAPLDPYQYAALPVHHQLQTSWFNEALSNVAIACPDVKVGISTTWGRRGIVSSSASSGHEVLNTLQPYIRTPMSHTPKRWRPRQSTASPNASRPKSART